jgi:hypothetical protein
VRDVDMSFYGDAGAEIGRVAADSTSWVSFDKHPTGGAYFQLACDALRLHKKVPAAA